MPSPSPASRTTTTTWRRRPWPTSPPTSSTLGWPGARPRPWPTVAATGAVPDTAGTRFVGVADRVSSRDLIRWSESLSAIARTGLGFTENLYERERFEEVLKVAADVRVAASAEGDAATVVQEWLDVVGDGVAGYVTPKVAVGAVVGND